MSAASLIFRPRNLILFIEEYVEGNYIEKLEWPISEKKFTSKIVPDTSELALREKDISKKSLDKQNEITFNIVKLIIEDQTSNL